MNKTKYLIILFLLVITLSNLVSAADDLYLFYGDGCPHCSKAKTFLNDLDYNLTVIQKEVYFNSENRDLLRDMSQFYGEEVQGVPTIFYNDKIFVGFNDETKDSILNEIIFCNTHDCEISYSQKNNSENYNYITISAVISAAIIDAINPCAFAVLIILLTTILTKKNSKKALFSGLAFSFSIFISYLLMGVGLYSAIRTSNLTHNFYILVSILAIILGLFNLKDYFRYGKWFIMEVPISWRPNLKKILQGVTSIPGSFLVGFLVSLFLLPCTSGPYIVVLGLLSKIATRNYAFMLLIFYNLIFITPMILITFAVYFGLTNVDKAEKFRKSKLELLHLIAGIILLVMGLIMIFSINLGFI